MLQKLAFSGFLELHFLQWAHNFRLGIATNRPWGPPINFKSRMTNAPSMVIEQKAMSLSAVFSTSLILTSVISMAFPHWPYHHHPPSVLHHVIPKLPRVITKSPRHEPSGNYIRPSSSFETRSQLLRFMCCSAQTKTGTPTPGKDWMKRI